jgi:WhiB family redox-sensing transcriptional regulator
MSKQIKRKQVDWERASCRGIDTDLFYEHKTGMEERGLTMNHLRRICFSCPIQRDCLTIGVAHEPFGFWGGLSEEERRHMHARKESKALFNLRKDLRMLGISYDKILQHVFQIKRDFTYSDESKI